MLSKKIFSLLRQLQGKDVEESAPVETETKVEEEKPPEPEAKPEV